MKSRIPRILLIGAGAFGSKHLKTLLDLEKKKILNLAGVVVKTPESQKLIQAEFKAQKKAGIPVYVGLDEKILTKVDGVDIVTPVETHTGLVRQCIPHAHVLVEKPLAATEAEATILEDLSKTAKHSIMVGHIFRYHPAVLALKDLLKRMKAEPHTVHAVFVNPINTDNGRDVELEMLHPFDMIDFILDREPVKKHVEDKGRFKIVSIIYKKGISAVVKLGWAGSERVRTLRFALKDKLIVCDMEKSTVTVRQHGRVIESIDCQGPSPLEAELRQFVSIITNGKKPEKGHPDVAVGSRMVKFALAGRTKIVDKPGAKKKIAIIGAGIFGTNCAIELSPEYDVTILEKNNSILSEASFINQYRIHWGYHYPRSQETVDDIRKALGDFELRYNKAIVRKFPTYYSIAKRGSKVKPEEYMAFCDRNRLPYTVEMPHEKYLDRSKIALCLKTFEPIYNYEKLKEITSNLLRKHKVKLNLNKEVIHAEILPDGRKRLTMKSKWGTRSEDFDYVINVTYARYNAFVKWLGFFPKSIRLDLVETLWVKLNIPKISLAVMDGKFTNVVPTGNDGIFTLVHIKESVLRRFVPKDGLVPKNIFKSIKQSRVKKIIDKSAVWFPILKTAKLVRVHYVLRGVNANREHDDSRTSDITEHGFGCFSILGGKVDNSVGLAKEMSRIIAGPGLS